MCHISRCHSIHATRSPTEWGSRADTQHPARHGVAWLAGHRAPLHIHGISNTLPVHPGNTHHVPSGVCELHIPAQPSPTPFQSAVYEMMGPLTQAKQTYPLRSALLLPLTCCLCRPLSLPLSHSSTEHCSEGTVS